MRPNLDELPAETAGRKRLHRKVETNMNGERKSTAQCIAVGTTSCAAGGTLGYPVKAFRKVLQLRNKPAFQRASWTSSESCKDCVPCWGFGQLLKEVSKFVTRLFFPASGERRDAARCATGQQALQPATPLFRCCSQPPERRPLQTNRAIGHSQSQMKRHIAEARRATQQETKLHSFLRFSRYILLESKTFSQHGNVIQK